MYIVIKSVAVVLQQKHILDWGSKLGFVDNGMKHIHTQSFWMEIEDIWNCVHDMYVDRRRWKRYFVEARNSERQNVEIKIEHQNLGIANSLPLT
jgi:hypothetical protein